MKKIKIIIALIIFLIGTFIVKITVEGAEAMVTWRAKETMLQQVNIKKEVRNASDRGGLEGNVITHKHIVFASLWYREDDPNTDGNSYIYFLDKETGEVDTNSTITVPNIKVKKNTEINEADSIYGHMNDMTYNPDTGEIFIPFIDELDGKFKVAIITYSDKYEGIVNKNIEVVDLPEGVRGASAMAYNRNYGYMFFSGVRIYIVQREGKGFANEVKQIQLCTSVSPEADFFNAGGQGIFSKDNYIYLVRFEAGYDNEYQLYYDENERGSNIIIIYKINDDNESVSFVKTLYIPSEITMERIENSYRSAEMESGSFDPESGKIYLGYQLSVRSNDQILTKTKIFCTLKTGLQEINGNTYCFDINAIMKTGWQNIDGKYYYFATETDEEVREGQMLTGWHKLQGRNEYKYWYYFCERENHYSGYPKGSMLIGRHQVTNGGYTSWYYFCEQDGTPSYYEQGGLLRGETYGGYTYGDNGRDLDTELTYYTLTINPNGGTYEGTTTYTQVSNNIDTIVNIGTIVPATYTVTFDGKGGTNPELQSVTSIFKTWILSGIGTLSGSTYIFGEGHGTVTAAYDIRNNKLTNLPISERTGYIFRGWYKDEAYTIKFSANETITSNITLYAKWTKIEDVIETQYTLSENMIEKIQPSTIESNFTDNIGFTSDLGIKVVDKNNNELGQTDIVKTGDKLQVIDASTEDMLKEFTIVVIGDTNGDGQANVADILAINKHRLNKEKLTGEYLAAGDVNEDNLVDVKDILKINKYRLGKIDSL